MINVAEEKNLLEQCSVYRKNDMCAMETFKANSREIIIQFVGNDLTNDKTKSESEKELKKLDWKGQWPIPME